VDALVAAHGELRTTVREGDDELHARLESCGFVVDRRESLYRLPTDPSLTGLAHAALPGGFELATADRVDRDRLRLLDDALRQDVPGTRGWRWEPDAFEAETFASPAFDPATYLVAVERASGECAGLVRVWNNPEGPRAGLVAVLPQHRRRGLARALLAEVLAVLHRRGVAEVSAEVDDANTASTALVRSIGARRTGGILELVRPRTPST
jgi:ribosomal protein S18 acetylase RimI-like enzyme